VHLASTDSDKGATTSGGSTSKSRVSKFKSLHKRIFDRHPLAPKNVGSTPTQTNANEEEEDKENVKAEEVADDKKEETEWKSEHGDEKENSESSECDNEENLLAKLRTMQVRDVCKNDV